MTVARGSVQDFSETVEGLNVLLVQGPQGSKLEGMFTRWQSEEAREMGQVSREGTWQGGARAMVGRLVR